VFCNNCGHQNPLASNFCSACGGVLSAPAGDPNTVTFQIEAVPGTEEVAVDLADLATGGVMVVTRGPNAGSRFALDADVVRAGRHPESDIFLDDVTVSRNHVELIRDEAGNYRVHDVGSLNGTYLNRERIEDAPLHGGDELQIGKFKLVYLEGGE
jgi:pSer/pThr/pTyr-binding forkhead associated (FHA) protein